jgi:hypothetical protein
MRSRLYSVLLRLVLGRRRVRDERVPVAAAVEAVLLEHSPEVSVFLSII